MYDDLTKYELESEENKKIIYENLDKIFKG